MQHQSRTDIQETANCKYEYRSFVKPQRNTAWEMNEIPNSNLNLPKNYYLKGGGAIRTLLITRGYSGTLGGSLKSRLVDESFLHVLY